MMPEKPAVSPFAWVLGGRHLIDRLRKATTTNLGRSAHSKQLVTNSRKPLYRVETSPANFSHLHPATQAAHADEDLARGFAKEMFAIDLRIRGAKSDAKPFINSQAQHTRRVTGSDILAAVAKAHPSRVAGQ